MFTRSPNFGRHRMLLPTHKAEASSHPGPFTAQSSSSFRALPESGPGLVLRQSLETNPKHPGHSKPNTKAPSLMRKFCHTSWCLRSPSSSGRSQLAPHKQGNKARGTCSSGVGFVGSIGQASDKNVKSSNGKVHPSGLCCLHATKPRQTALGKPRELPRW